MNNTTTQIDDVLDFADILNFANAFCALFVSLSLFGILGNALVITVIVLVKAMRTTVNFCLGCLAAVDLFVLVVDATYYSLRLASSPSFHYYKCALSVTHISFIICSHLIFLLIGVERYTLLCHPLKSLGWWTWKKVCLAMAIICVVTAGVALPYGIAIKYEKKESFTYENVTYEICEIYRSKWVLRYLSVVLCFASFLPISVLIWLYCKMIIAMRAKMPERSGPQGAIARGPTKSRSEVVAMLAVVVTVFVICVLPYEIWELIERHHFIPSMRLKTFLIIDALIRVLLYVNHTSNPVVYFLMSDSFRQAFKYLFCRRQGHAV